VIIVNCNRCNPSAGPQRVDVAESDVRVVCPGDGTAFVVAPCPRCSHVLRQGLGGDPAVLEALRADGSDFHAQLR